MEEFDSQRVRDYVVTYLKREIPRAGGRFYPCRIYRVVNEEFNNQFQGRVPQGVSVADLLKPIVDEKLKSLGAIQWGHSAVHITNSKILYG